MISPMTAPPFPDMAWIPGGTFRMGSDKHYPEERPVHRVSVDVFWMDRYPVTNERFMRFVEATGHRTFAEIPPDPKDYPEADPATERSPGNVLLADYLAAGGSLSPLPGTLAECRKVAAALPTVLLDEALPGSHLNGITPTGVKVMFSRNLVLCAMLASTAACAPKQTTAGAADEAPRINRDRNLIT